VSELGWKYLTRSDKKLLLRGMRDGTAYGGPFHVEIQPADRCNIDCFFCSTAAIRGRDELPLDRLQTLITELKEAGTRSIRLAGGGEPLFHRRIVDFLRAVRDAALPIENITTNAVLLGEEVAKLLIATCDLVTVSLNTATAQSYAAMMQTPERNFERVVRNVEQLIRQRNEARSRTPRVNLQFLVWKENFRQIPEMYALATRLGVDTIQFNGLAYLKPEQQMTAEETDEMMKLYREIVAVDEYRRIAVINSFEQDLSARVTAMNQELAGIRQRIPRWRRLVALLKRTDFTLRQKVEHSIRMRRTARTNRRNASVEDLCLIGWHSLVIRSEGTVAPCCILQGGKLGNVFTSSVGEVWYGEKYQAFRQELGRILREGERWKSDPERDQTVEALCGKAGACPMSTFYYLPDAPFVQNYERELRGLRS
jgi:MoaA/NifB/PqqE/SkfB family radical SAM enzyme